MTGISSHKIPYYVLSDFEDLKDIGRGTGGTVSIGKLEDFGLIALKQFNNSRNNPMEQYRKEIEFLLELNHPNIVQMFGILWDGLDKSQYLGYVMEYIEGGSLHDVIHNDSKPYDWPQVQKWIGQTARGLLFLHRWIIHRDIKPANILVDGNQLKLADFGIAKAINTTMTAGAGTLRYMAVEVLNSGNCSPASDIFSLAITIWEIIHRKVPYQELQHSVNLIFMQQVISGARPIIEPNKMSRETAELLERCWQKAPENRPTLKEIIDYFDKNVTSNGEVFCINGEKKINRLPGQMGNTWAGQKNTTMHPPEPHRVIHTAPIVPLHKTIKPNIADFKRTRNVTVDRIEVQKTVGKKENPAVETAITPAAVSQPECGTANELPGKKDLPNEKPNEHHGKAAPINRSKPVNADVNAQKPKYIKKDTVLIFGGYEKQANEVVTDSTDKLLLLRGDRWIKLSLKLPKKTASHGIVYLHGEIYIFGGQLGKEFYKFDKNLKWIRLADMNKERLDNANSCLEWNGDIWALGGFSQNTQKTLNSVERYSIKENKWIEMPAMKHARYNAAAAVWNGKLMVFGGSWYGSILDSVECYDPKSGIWTEFGKLLSPLFGHAVIPYKNSLILIGGSDGKTATNSVWQLRNSGGKYMWKKLPSMKERRCLFSAVVLNDEIMVIGGWDAVKTRLASTEKFNGTEWKNGPDLPCANHCMAAITIPQHFANTPDT